jgi:phage-related protein
MGTVAGNLVTSFITLLDAASPLIDRFTDWVVVLTDGWKKTLDAKNASGELTTMFNNAGDIAAQLGDIFGNLFGAIMNIGKAASGPGSGGQMLFDFLEEATAKFKEWTGGALKDGSLEEFFKATTGNFIKLLEIIGIVVAAILKTGDDKGTAKFFDSLKSAAQTLADALGKLSESGLVEGFGKFIELMAKFIATTTESGSIKTYFGILNTALGLLVTLMSNPAVQKIFGLLATVHGARVAFGTMGRVVSKVGLYIQGDLDNMKKYGTALKNMGGNFKAARSMGMGFASSLKMTLGYTKLGAAASKVAGAATKVWSGIQAAFNAVMALNPIALTVIAIVALIAIVVVMYMKFKWFRDFVHTVWDAIKDGLSAAWDFIKVIGEKIGSFFAAIWGGIKSAWDAVWPALVLAFKIAVGLLMLPFMALGAAIYLIWLGIKAAFDLVWPLIWGAIKFAWESIIKPIFDLMLSLFTIVWNGIKAVFTVVWDIIKVAIGVGWAIIKPIFDLMLTVFKLAWDGIKTAFNFVWDIIKAAISAGWGVIKPIFEAFGKIFGAVWDGIKKAFQTAWDFITKAVDGAKTVFSGIGDVIIKAFKSAINFIIRAWNAIEFKVPSVTLFGKTVGGFTLGLPDLPELAEGGVINPTPGGTLARIGEAGRAERVEPLDSEGLSKRDRAIITMLSGGAGGINITVNPSPGMDEVELASLVSRQLAFQLRRGAA